jgi:hypothetical protein
MAALAIGVAGVSSAAAEPRPFRLIGNQIVVPARIEGRDTLALLDTGANVSLMSDGLAAALDLKHRKMPGGVMGATGRRAARRATQEVVVDLGDGLSIKRRLGVFPSGGAFASGGVQAIIGVDMLRDQIVTIDFERLMIDFTPSRSSTPPAEPAAPLGAVWWRGPTIRIDLGEQSGDFLVDTAASSAMHLSGVFERKISLLEGLPASETMVAGVDGSHARPIASLPGMVVAGHTFENVPVTVGPISRTSFGDGIVGVDLLKRFNLVIDFGRNRMWLTPNSNRDAPFRRNRIGIVASEGAGRGTVRLVAPGSPAERAGFKAGETISAFEDAAGSIVTDLMAIEDGEEVTAVMADGSRRKLAARAYY